MVVWKILINYSRCPAFLYPNGNLDAGITVRIENPASTKPNNPPYTCNSVL